MNEGQSVSMAGGKKIKKIKERSGNKTFLQLVPPAPHAVVVLKHLLLCTCTDIHKHRRSAAWQADCATSATTGRTGARTGSHRTTAVVVTLTFLVCLKWTVCPFTISVIIQQHYNHPAVVCDQTGNLCIANCLCTFQLFYFIIQLLRKWLTFMGLCFPPG